jgi:signal transduction histidine kinase
LVREAAHRADTARRSAAFMFQFGVSMVAFALAPLVPGAGSLFGALTAPLGMALVSPGVVAACVSVLLFRRRGSECRVYRASEVLESFLLYAAPLAMIFVSRTTWSVLWILPAFTVVFWANAKPFDSRIYVSILVVAHGALALAQVVRGHADAAKAAWLAIEVGVACGFTHEWLARRGRNTLRLKADSNVLRSALNAARLDGERERVAGMLRERVGAAIAALATELDSGALEKQARSVLTELQEVGAVAEDVPISLGDLAGRLEDRCRPLCVDAAYAQSVVGDHGATIDGRTAHALVRVSQELVRNAVTHGRAQQVSVEMAVDARATTVVVRDDGVGLSEGTLARATGGLHNARQWLREHGGVLEHVVAGSAVTELRAVIPARGVFTGDIALG